VFGERPSEPRDDHGWCRGSVVAVCRFRASYGVPCLRCLLWATEVRYALFPNRCAEALPIWQTERIGDVTGDSLARMARTSSETTDGACITSRIKCSMEYIERCNGFEEFFTKSNVAELTEAAGVDERYEHGHVFD